MEYDIRNYRRLVRTVINQCHRCGAVGTMEAVSMDGDHCLCGACCSAIALDEFEREYLKPLKKVERKATFTHKGGPVDETLMCVCGKQATHRLGDSGLGACNECVGEIQRALGCQNRNFILIPKFN